MTPEVAERVRRRDEARLENAKVLLRLAASGMGVIEMIDAAARECHSSNEWTAETFWELVRLQYLDSRGRL